MQKYCWCVQGDATLEGAQFEVKFYDVMSDTDPEKLGEKPLRTWIFQTKEVNGTYRVNYAKSYLVSGDELYTSGITNTPSLPYGTVTFKEIAAPEGYLINDQVIVAKVGETLNTEPIYHEPIIKDVALSIDIVKVQSGTSTPIPGVTFKHSGPDGFSETAVTDNAGKVSFKGLTYGNHTIEETKTVDGYALNTQKITFTVNRDNTIKITSTSTETDTNGKITVSVGGDGNIDAVVENKPAPFTLHVYKTNNHDFALQGAEFTLYSDAGCKTVVDTQVTDSKGNLNFTGLVIGKEYYLKETKAPTGYRIPVNSDGSAIVWKVKAVSNPMDKSFTVYVNDKAYNSSSSGSITVSGGVAGMVVNMTVINEVGMKLPNTGSSWMIVLVMAGLALVCVGLVFGRSAESDSFL